MLLNQTILKKNLDEVSKEEFNKGLDNNEINEFINFINNLEEVDSTDNNNNNNFPVNDENITEKDSSEEKQDNNNKNAESEVSFSINIEKKNNKEKEINTNNSNSIHILDIKIVNDSFESDIDNNNIDIEKIKSVKSKKAIISIEKSKKDLIINYLKNFYNSINKDLAKLYSLESPKFYYYINKWLMSLNNDIYQRISPIAGKITNFIYSNIQSRNKNKDNIKLKLYRGFLIKKADIF